MTGKFFNVALIAVLLCSSTLSVKLPSFKGSVKIAEFIERDVNSALEKFDNDMARHIS